MSIVERYVHSFPKKNRNWNQGYIQYVSIDPGQVNFAFRMERRYSDGRIIPIVFWKQAFRSNTYQNIFKKLEEFKDEYINTHVVLIEKQPPRSITINRIMQHALTYFMTTLKDYPLLPEINEISPHLKGNELGAPPDINLKKWASKKAREELAIREDDWSLDVMNYWLQSDHPKGERKDDDLADTIVMIEAYCRKKGHLQTISQIPQIPAKPHINLVRVSAKSNNNNNIKNIPTQSARPKIKINRIKADTVDKAQPKKIVINRTAIKNKPHNK